MRGKIGLPGPVRSMDGLSLTKERCEADFIVSVAASEHRSTAIDDQLRSGWYLTTAGNAICTSLKATIREAEEFDAPNLST